MRLVRVTEIQNGKLFPRLINPEYVIVIEPGVPRQLKLDDSYVSVPASIIHFVDGKASMLVQGNMEEIHNRLVEGDLS